MTTMMTNQTVSPDDLLNMPDAVDYELVKGHLVRRNLGYESSHVGVRLICHLMGYCRQHNLGTVTGANAGFQCFPDDPGKVRKPNIALVRNGRFPNGKLPKGHCPIVPDLAAEILTPNDNLYDVETKIQEYIDAGVRLIWLINPDQKTVRAYHLNGTDTLYHKTDTLPGEDIVPGFECTVSELFK